MFIKLKKMKTFVANGTILIVPVCLFRNKDRWLGNVYCALLWKS